MVNAPAAATGFAITFSVDDINKHSRHPAEAHATAAREAAHRVVPGRAVRRNDYAALPASNPSSALATNPLNIAADPEFIALNPGLPTSVATEGAATLLALSSNSDVIRSLTSYLNADPETRSWLDGNPDPWGMLVNPAYKGIELPVDSWPLLDSFIPPSIENSNVNDCLAQDSVPFLPLVASPVSRMESITEAMQFSILNSQTVCQQVGDTNEGEKLVAQGRQTIGFRFMLGLTSYGDAERYGLSTAALQTTVSASAPVKFSTAAGRTFVAPSQTSLRNAAALLTPDTTHNMWTFPYADLHDSAKAAAAYPGFMLIYIAAPTAGVTPSTDAARIATLMRFAGSSGQTPGSGNGELPAGFLPLTSANGLGAEATYSKAAADAVAAQQGTIPSVTEPFPPAAPTTPATTSGDGSTAGDGSTGSDSGTASDTPAPASSATPAASTTTAPELQTVALGRTQVQASGVAGAFLPIALGVCLLCLIGAPAWAYWARRRMARSL